MTITIAMTIANTGRSIKKRATLVTCLPGRGLIWLGCDRNAGADVHLAFDDYAVPGFEALLNNPVVSNTIARGHRTRFDLVAGANRINGLEALHLLYSPLRNQDSGFAVICLEADAAELAWQETAFRIREARLHFESAGLRIDFIEDAFDAARVRPCRAVREDQLQIALAGSFALAIGEV